MASSLSEIYTDEQLNIGKLLVLDEGHKLTSQEIKKTIKAERVRKIKWEGMGNIDSFILSKAHQAATSLLGKNCPNLDVYYVHGIDATSIFLRLKKTEFVRASIEWNSETLKHLNNALFLKDKIELVKSRLVAAKFFHDDLSETLTSHELPNSLKNKTISFEKFVENYGDVELKGAVNKIEDAMKNRW